MAMLRGYRFRALGRVQLIARGRLRAKQITDEIIPALAGHPGLRPAGVFMVLIRQHDEIEGP